MECAIIIISQIELFLLNTDMSGCVRGMSGCVSAIALYVICVTMYLVAT